MADELWGSVAGARLWDIDAFAAAQQQAQTQEALGRIAQQPAEKSLKESQAEAAKIALAKEKRLEELMKQATMRGGTANQLDQLAQLLMQAGMPEAAAKYAGEASLIRQRDSSAAASVTSQMKTAMDVTDKHLELVSQLFGSAHDEATWKEAGVRWEAQTGLPNPFAGRPYDAGLVERINQDAIDGKTRTEIARKKADAAALEEHRNNIEKQREISNNIAKMRLELERQREARLAKAGGKRVSTPQQQEIDHAERLIKKHYPNFVGDLLYNEAFELASAGRAVGLNNPALTASGAINQAFLDFVKSGRYETKSKELFGIKIPFTEETAPREEPLTEKESEKKTEKTEPWPKIGDCELGYCYKGGDPHDPDNWEEEKK